MYRTKEATRPREAMILIVVLCLLTLFAIIGISFVLYAESVALSSRLSVGAENVTLTPANSAAQQALNLFLGQFMYGTSDTASVLRGYDLGTDLYGGYGGQPPSGQSGQLTPFCGTGRLHYPYGAGFFGGIDDFNLVNYQYCPSDGVYRDPERYDQSGAAYTTAGQIKPYVGGYNPPYTYPDRNHLFLGAIRASDGAIIAPSFHRSYSSTPGGFGTLAPSNPNWSSSAQTMKYQLLRPHPSYHPTFPLPVDLGGDVRNLPWSPGMVDPSTGSIVSGSCDSFWMDIDGPIQTDSNGVMYKPLMAVFVTDLDGKLNVNAAGNVRNNNGAMSPVPPISASNMGFGAWEINPAYVLDATDTANSNYPEYADLFLVRPDAPITYGRYGQDQRPGNGSTTAPGGRAPHYYTPVDFDAVFNYTSASGTGSPTGATLSFPTGTNLFPTYPPGYESGGVELPDHPMLYNPFVPLPQTTPGKYDLRYASGDLEQLLRYGDVGYQTHGSALLQQLPINFSTDPTPANAARRRLEVTTDSTDFVVGGAAAYIADPTAAPTLYTLSGTSPVPQGAGFNTPNLIAANMPPNTPVGWGEFGTNWQYKVTTALKRINLNRTLTPYPTYNLTQRHDDNSTTPYTSAQYLSATADRQQFANDIYRVLLTITGVAPVAAPTAPTDQELAPRRWLAQLAVNIVDYIDEDNISTMFNYYGTADGLNPANLGDNCGTPMGSMYPNNPGVPRYWVAGTEMPRLLLNEVLAEANDSNPMHTIMAPPAAPLANYKVWVELFNPLNAPGTSPQAQDAAPVPLQVANIPTSANPLATNAAYAPYRIVVTNPSIGNSNMLGNADGFAETPAGANVFGEPDVAPYAPFYSSADGDFGNNTAYAYPSTTMPIMGLPSVGTSAMGSTPYFLIGPPTDSSTSATTGSQTSAATWMCDPLASGSLVPANTPYTRPGTSSLSVSSGLSIVPTATTAMPPNGSGNWSAASTTDQRTTGVTVLLRRLANPQAPYDPNAFTGTGVNAQLNPWYNPYITIDYVDQVPIRDPNQDTTPATLYASRAKVQPFVNKTIVTGGVIRTVDTMNSQVQDQTTADAGVKPASGTAVTKTYHTFGAANAPVSNPYTWLVHLDRQVVSPMELLHVSGYPQYQLTQQFITGAAPAQAFNHLVPWLDNDAALTPGNSHRLYRLFEYLDAGSRPSWTGIGNRIPGKININTVWDKEIFRALCDANTNNFINSTATIDSIFLNNIVPSRTPGSTGMPPTQGIPSANDNPIMPLSSGLVPAGDAQYPNGQSIQNTLLRTMPGGLLMLEDPSGTTALPPYQRYQMLTKIFNNVTNRSNCFAVWLTVGYFTVTNASATPPVLGPEYGLSSGTNVRHRMFVIVDRSRLTLFSTTLSQAINVASRSTYPYPITGQYDPGLLGINNLSSYLAAASGTNSQTGATWALGAGQVVVVEPDTPNEEAVVVTGTAPFAAVFRLSHPTGATVIIRGNPGPWQYYDYRQDPAVLYTSIIN